jgi:hypothetical protein
MSGFAISSASHPTADIAEALRVRGVLTLTGHSRHQALTVQVDCIPGTPKSLFAEILHQLDRLRPIRWPP